MDCLSKCDSYKSRWTILAITHLSERTPKNINKMIRRERNNDKKKFNVVLEVLSDKSSVPLFLSLVKLCITQTHLLQSRATHTHTHTYAYYAIGVGFLSSQEEVPAASAFDSSPGLSVSITEITGLDIRDFGPSWREFETVSCRISGVESFFEAAAATGSLAAAINLRDEEDDELDRVVFCSAHSTEPTASSRLSFSRNSFLRSLPSFASIVLVFDDSALFRPDERSGGFLSPTLFSIPASSLVGIPPISPAVHISELGLHEPRDNVV